MKLSVLLRLSRISNLPTAWSNVLVGVALVGGAWQDWRLALLLLSISLFFSGGMLLNDAFDREFDARQRPERPIPSGEVTARAVFALGFGMLATGLALLLWVDWLRQGATPGGASLAGLALGGCIVFYNMHHKANALSPVVMGLCRMLVVITAALGMTTAGLSAQVYVCTLVLLCHLIGLTYAAKKEHLNRLDNAWPLALLTIPLLYGVWLGLQHPLTLLLAAALAVWVALAVRRLLRRASGDVPKAIVALIAGISLLDAMLLSSTGALVPTVLALCAFGLTLLLQRWVSGT